MKYCMTILALILYFKIIYTDSSEECPENNFIIIDKNGAKIDCLPCASCNVGLGLTFACGIKLTEVQRAKVNCVPCEPGKTYSEKHGPSLCKSCQICPVTLKNCTAESNTKCSKDCSKGQYYDNSTYNCQPCSYCCRKDNKRIAECAGQPAQSQCSVHDTQECSPKTTKNPRSTNDGGGSNGDKKGDKILVIVIVVAAAVVVAIVICVVVCFVRHREPSPDDHDKVPGDRVPLDSKPNNCGITKLSFFIKTQALFGDKALQEGEEMSLICENQGNAQEDYNFDDCDYIFDWKKDSMDYPCHGKKIHFNPVQVKDFGRYTCQVKCSKHPRLQPVEAAYFDLDVAPEPNKRCKKFNEINSIDVYDTIEDMLKSPPPGIGDWKRVAEKYSMESSKIQALEKDDNRGLHVINYLKASQPELTVYNFCKFMKIMKQNQIVQLLEKHLTCEDQERQVNTRARDSGYCPDHESNGTPPLPSSHFLALNNPGLINSRQGSRNELTAGNSQNGKENPDKGNRKIERQISNQSAKSSGSGSGSTSSSLTRAVRGFARQISQTSAYKKHENEDGDHPP